MTGQFVERSTPQPPRFHIRRLISRFAAVALAGALGAVAVGAPASAVPSGGIYQPHCYDTLCLGVDRVTDRVGNPVDVLLAWSRYDVGPTPYYISIFDSYSGERLGLCAWGTSCRSSLGFERKGCSWFYAYIGGSGESRPPAPVLQMSAELTYCPPDEG